MNEQKVKCRISLNIKLRSEIEMTMKLAMDLLEANIPASKIIVEFDLNPLKRFESSTYVPLAVGWASGCGFETIIKHDSSGQSQIAVKAANHRSKS
jgi:predicted RNase H-related nuclease YkuK (DUF458 family)